MQVIFIHHSCFLVEVDEKPESESGDEEVEHEFSEEESE